VSISSGGVISTQDELADLEKLAAELAGGLPAKLCIPAGRLAYPAVRNSRVSVLAEKVYKQADAYCFAWVEKIAGCDEVTDVADHLAAFWPPPPAVHLVSNHSK
jgi:hypothetical protein